MKAAFSAPSRVEVVLSRLGADGKEGEKIVLTLAPSPIGFREYLELVFPKPLFYLNGKPEGLDPKKGPGWGADLQLILLGKSLGDQVDTPFPAQLDEAKLSAYVQGLRAEFERSNLTTGDLNRLLLGLEKANMGMGKGALGNGRGSSSSETEPSAEKSASR